MATSPVASGAWRKHNKNQPDLYHAAEAEPVKVRIHHTTTAPIEVDDDDNDLDEATKNLVKNGFLVAADIEGPDNDEIEATKQTYRRKVKCQVEVPVIRKVKVPTVTTEEVEVEEIVKIRTTETIQVPSVMDVEEEYVDVEEVTAYRIKEIWVKKLVPEAYTKKVEVKKVRIVQVPTTVSKEVEVEKEVPIKRKRIVEVPAFRIDEIKDTKLVEVEAYQTVEVVPRTVVGNLKLAKTVDLTGPQGRVLERKVGQVCDTADERLDDIDTDSENDEPDARQTTGVVQLDGSETRVKRKDVVPASAAVRQLKQSPRR